jgi:ATP-binding cassette subfamily F protein uup
MEAKILATEEKLAAMTAESTRPEVVSNAAQLLELTEEMARLQAEVERLYARWQELLA